MPKKTDEIEVTDRDFVLARCAVARTALQDAINAIDEFVGLCIHPAEDKRGKTRKECIATALEASGVAVGALECAEENVGAMDMAEVEPWEGEDDEEDEDDEDDEDEDDDEEEDD